MELKKINKVLDITKHHIFYKGKELTQLSQKTINDVKKSIKEHVYPPKTCKKVYMISLKYNPKSEKRRIIVVCGQYTITPKLVLAKDDDDDSFSITYTSYDFKKYNFDISHIKKIISKIKKEELDVGVQFISISEILKQSRF